MWKSLVVQGGVLAGPCDVVATWQGPRSIKGQWLLQYWGNPMATWAPKKFRPSRGFDPMLPCSSDAEVVTAYAAIVKAVRKKYPRTKLDGPEPDDPLLVKKLARGDGVVAMSGPPGHSMQIALHKLTHTLLAEAALQVSREDNRTVIAETSTGRAVIGDAAGHTHVAASDGDLLVVHCDKRAAGAVLPDVLARTGFREKRLGTIALDGELAIGTWQRANKVAAALRCKRGTYGVFVGNRDDATYLRLRNS